MPRKKGIRDFKIEIPEELDERLKKVFKRKGQKSKVVRVLLEDFCRSVESKYEVEESSTSYVNMETGEIL